MNEPNHTPHEPQDVGPPPRDELDELLRDWHRGSTDQATDARARVMRAMRALSEAGALRSTEPDSAGDVQVDAVPVVRERHGRRVGGSRLFILRRLVMNRYSPIAASIVLVAALAWFLTPAATKPAKAGDVIMAPDGGRLDAIDKEGNVLGPCPLKHTDVAVEVSGQFTRVTLSQLYHNPYKDKIEAVYTFPLSHRAAVDRMKMTVGDRVVIGEVHERARARAIYEAAKQSGYVASLLEQERPNIFTQSVANIEPDTDVLVEISYVELLQAKDGTYSFEFPMVVGLRYIPGSMPTAMMNVPAGLKPRQGLILLCPSTLSVGQQGDVSQLGTLQTGKLTALLRTAVPIAAPEAEWWTREDAKPEANAGQAPHGGQGVPAANPQLNPQNSKSPVLWYQFEAAYPDGSKERGAIFTDGTGQLNGRWFYTDPKTIKGMGTGFAPDTTQVPDASRITPEPVKPGKRAGHNISIRVTLDTGGPGIVDLKSPLHDIIETKKVQRDDGSPRKVTLELKKEVEIPNRDFVLTWRQTADTIQEATFAHTGKQGKFFTLILQPPARVADPQAVPRELVFVLDTSGSMSGFPIEKAKEVMTRAIGALRPQDTFNLITFSGDTRILWDKPRPGTKESIAEAQAFLASRQGGGGTEMMKAINAALVQTPQTTGAALDLETLANLPADGRETTVVIDWTRYETAKLSLPYSMGDQMNPLAFRVSGGARIEAHIPNGDLQPAKRQDRDVAVVPGKWLTKHGHAMLIVDHADWADAAPARPIRICCFMTDGYVGNDMQIIDAVRKNAKTTRVFSFGIGNSVNRYLLDGMARAGRGEVEYVLLQSNADEAAKRFAQRIQTPVLTDVELTFSDGLKITDLIPKQLPDLFDVKPLIIHGRYTVPGRGTLTIRGNTGAGRYERAVPIDLPAEQPEHDTIATLWARAKVEYLMNQDLGLAQTGNFPAELKQEVINLGEQFQIMTQFTSFVAVEKIRVTVGGQPMLVAVPVEMPQGVSYEGVFGRLSGEEAEVAVKKMGIRALTVTPLVTTRPANDPEWTLRASREISFNTPVASPTQPSASVSLTPRAEPAVPPPAPPPPAKVLNVITASPTMPSASPGTPQGHVLYSFGSGSAAGPSARLSADARNVYYGSSGNASGGAGGGGSAGGGGMMDGYGGHGGGSVQLFDADGDRITGIPLRNAPPEEVAQMLNNVAQSSYGSRSGRGQTSVQIEPVTNKLVVKSRPSDHAEIARFVEQLDRAQPTDGRHLEVWDDKTGALVIAGHPGQIEEVQALMKQLESKPPSKVAALLPMYGDATVGPLNAPLLRERIALGIGELVGEGKIDEAKKLAEQLVGLDANYTPGVQMRDTLADAKLAPAERDKRIKDLAAEARKAIEAFLRDARLRHRLDSRLYRYVNADASTTKPADLTFVDGAVMVKLLAARVDDAAIGAMKKAGLKVEAAVKSTNLVVGLAPRDRLADIALLDGVRKVEPAERWDR